MGTAALATVGVGVLQIIAVMDVRRFLAAVFLSAKMALVAMGRLVKAVLSGIAALSMAGVGVRQTTALLGVKWLLEPVES